jgi:hypothetical protein
VKWVPGNNGAAAGRHDLKSIADRAGLENDELVSLLEASHRLLGEQEG